MAYFVIRFLPSARSSLPAPNFLHRDAIASRTVLLGPLGVRLDALYRLGRGLPDLRLEHGVQGAA